MPQILSELKLNEISLVDKPANSTIDANGKRTPRAVVALFKQDDGEDDCGCDEDDQECQDDCEDQNFDLRDKRKGSKRKDVSVDSGRHSGPRGHSRFSKDSAVTAPHSGFSKEGDDDKATPSQKKGLQFLIGFPKGGGGSTITSVLFDKDVWTSSAARAWLKSHNMKSGDVDETANTYRFRQEDPSGFTRFRVIGPSDQAKYDVEKEVPIAAKHDYGPDDEDLWGAVNGDPESRLNKNGECQTQGGQCYPASDYAYVPDRTKPSTWKLRLTSTPGGKPDSGIVGAAAAALGPGFRGRKVQIPSSARGAVMTRVRAAWRAANPGRDADEMPDVLKKFDQGATMTLEEVEAQVSKQDEEIAFLKKRNADLDAENALVIKMSKKERKLYASMGDDTRKAFMEADVLKRRKMMTEAKAKLREKKLEDSMDEACKREYEAAGPSEQAAILERQEVLVERLKKRRKAQRDDESDRSDQQDDGDDQEDDDREDDGDDGDDGDGEKPDDKEKRRKVGKMYGNMDLRRKLAASEDRVAKVEGEMEDLRKRERDAYFARKAEVELPNTPGSPEEKGLMLEKLADTFGEDSADFKKVLANMKSADKVLSERFSEVGKGARGDIPALAVFDAKVEEIAKRDKIDKPHAVAKAMEEAPELYLEYERSQRGIVARA